MRKSLILILSLIITSYGVAQENTMQFSLQEAIDYALQNNRQVKNAQRNIEAAEEQKWETIATGLPQIDANVNYQNFLKQQVSVVPAEFFGGDPGDFEEVIFGTEQNVSATATLNQLIFDGSYLVGLQSVKVFLEISKYAKEKTDLEVRQNVINAYGNVLLAIESEAILERNKTVLQKNLDETTKIFENGLTEEESVEQLQITLSGIESLLKNATRLKVIAYQMLNLSLGIDINQNVILTDALEDLTTSNISLALLSAEEDVKSNIDFLIAENDKTSKELLVKLEKSKALPRLTGFINGGYLGFSNEFSFLDSDQNWAGFSSFGLNLNIPIFSSLGRASKTQRAKINLEIAEENLSELEQMLKLEIATAKSNYQFSIEDYQIKKENLKLAERIEAKNETKFFEGIASSFELRQAQSQLYNAQQEYLQAMLNVITNKAKLETILNRPNTL
ncbi:TolC family protein [uncultured Psychroserpens sp.]|uniref:TolC family protein n=1 Tax=uncultured Psychroserpens sp. TaxID=255436 RepID=UPI002637C1AB|nr:TolC family protein [uncultured Psychroserpens sp.]